MTVSRYPGRNGAVRWKFAYGYRRDGKFHKVERRDFPTRRDAQEAEQRSRQEQRSVDGSSVGDGTVGDYLRLWVRLYAESGSRKASTVASTRLHVERHLIPVLGSVRLRKLTFDVVQRTVNALHASGLAPATVGKIHGTLHKALGDAVRRRLIPYNPSEGVDLPRRVRYEGDGYDAGEIGVLLAHLSRSTDPGTRFLDHALLHLLFATGLRRGEALGLRWRDVDVVACLLTVRQTRIVVDGKVITTDPKSKAGNRTIEFDPDTRDALVRLRNALDDHFLRAGAPATGDDDYVATRFDGVPVHPLSFTRRFHRHTDKAGLRRIRLHDTRASHVQAAVAEGNDIVTVSHRVGHSRTSTTLDLYGRLLPSHDQRVASTVGRLLSQATRDAETSYQLRINPAGNGVSDRTRQGAEPLRDNDNDTEEHSAREATPGIEPGYRALQALA